MQRRIHSTILFLLLLLPSGIIAGNGPALRGCIKGCENSLIHLHRFYGDREIRVDSLYAGEDGCFAFYPAGTLPAGQYRLIFSKNRFLDLIYGSEEISFTTTLDHLIDSISISGSAENELYYRYLKFRMNSTYRIKHLKRMLAALPANSEHQKNIRHEIMSFTEQEEEFTRSLLAGREDSFLARMVGIDREPQPDPIAPKSYRDRYIFSRYLTGTDYSDSLLLYTNALSAEMISYLSLVPHLWPHPDSVINGFRLAACNLLAATGSSERMFNFIKEYLTNGFKRLGYQQLATEIDSIGFPAGSCSTGAETAAATFKLQAGDKFPLRKMEKSCSKPLNPGNEAGYLIVFPLPGCIWDSILWANIRLSLGFSTYSGYRVIVIRPKSESGQELHDNFIACTPDEKELRKITGFSGSPESPLLIAVSSKGITERTASTWTELTRKRDWITNR